MNSSFSRRRIALVSSSYHPHFGGVEEHVRHVARGLRDRGHEVEVWTVDRGEHLGEQIVDGVRVRYFSTPLPAKRMPNVLRFGLSAPGALARWVRAARQFRPDVLHIHCFGPNGIYALALSKVLRIPVVLSAHGETFMDAGDVFQRSALLRRGLVITCEDAAAVTGCSSLVVDDLMTRFGGSGIEVVPNGVEVLTPPPGPSKVRLDKERKRVVAVGRIVRVKGFDLLIRALSQLASDVDLLLVGDGSDVPELKSLAVDLGVASRVHFLGRRSAQEVQEIMAGGDVVVMPSRKEAFGIVALEAWASGTPLVATSLGGPRGFVTHGVDGLLVDPEDTAALAAAIDRVLGEAELASRLARAGAETVMAYSWDRVVEDYVRLYDEVL